MTVSEMPVKLNSYDERTLSVVCPVCNAARTARCLQPKRTGGWQFIDEPHSERVRLGQNHEQDALWGGWH